MKRLYLFVLCMLTGWLVNTDAYTNKILVSQTACNMFAEANKLYLEDAYYSVLSDMTEERFNEIIDSVVNHYIPIAESHNATLYVERNWDDPEVNAFASRPRPGIWQIAMYGGLARRPEVTDDGFAMVVCHELGHQFGGYPYARLDWAASEGQSDYFATQACARNIWKKEIEKNKAAAEFATQDIRNYCDAAWDEENDRNLCYRIGVGSQSLAHLLAKLRGSDTIPSPATPDQNEVPQTATVHPDPQCRLDTYLSGAVCRKSFDDLVIPGLVNGNGSSSSAAETEAAKYSCMRSDGSFTGTRPHCWFSPLMQLQLVAKDARLTEVEGNNDQIMDPGETYSLHVPVKNSFLFDVPSAQGILAGSEIELLEANAAYAVLPSETTTQPESPVVFKIPDAAVCGDSFELAYGIRSELLSHDVKLNYRTGAPDMLNEMLSTFTEPMVIPDKTDAGISDVLSQSAQDNVAEVDVHIQIDHSYVGDLQIELKEPNGHVHVLKRKYDGHGQNLDRIYKVTPSDPDAAGEWTLNVSDRAINDIGTLKAWGLKFYRIKCSSMR